MQLELDIIRIKDVKFGEKTQVKNGLLTINKDEMLDVLRDTSFESMEIDLARPGESVRIIPVKDVIEPRIKYNGTSFPGIIGDYDECGFDKTRVLEGCCVSTVGKIVGFQEGIIDMTGLGAEYTRYSKLCNIVIKADPVEGLEPHKHEEAVRLSGLKAAHYLAKETMEAKIDETKELVLEKTEKDLPRVGIMYLLMAQGLLHDNYLYGINAKNIHTTLVHPNEILDGAMVNGNCVVAGDKMATYDHQNNPLIEEMMNRHGKEIDFIGVIVVPVNPGLDDKKRCCSSAVNMARVLDLDGVIMPEEGGGNPEADLMMICKGCETHGIKTVMMFSPEGNEEPVTDATDEADAVIDLGESKGHIILPKMDKIIGYPEQIAMLSGCADGHMLEDGRVLTNPNILMGAVLGMGWSRLTSHLY